MLIQYTDNTNQELKEKAEGEVKEECLAIIVLYGADNGRFGVINTNLDKKINCGSHGSHSYSITKDKTMGLLNNYHVGKKHTRYVLVKE